MPLYELFCIASSSLESGPLRDLVKSTSQLVLNNGGAVRGMQYWGRRTLPQRTRRHQQYHTDGDYFLLHFDTNPRVLSTLSSRLRADPRVIRWTTLKLGERRLADVVPPGTSGHDGEPAVGGLAGTGIAMEPSAGAAPSGILLGGKTVKGPGSQ
ncbi:unnamed protein product [Tilletia controversa]|uniref:Ribosomal protein S6 n=3 Tax=Tilletia TaxID=13289 RepID=A0A8X7MQU2_9BASI|nr:hypothetical protein CF336_g4907 [Tilletia laevis]KAE8195138.1 hypothetical protein CF328_g4532 [Tilletia controversa]KAE8259106.1 hypothetical protein A4X03_0g4194 [Tilletia caries]KAE8199527.1 hypothetical protein CF335_g4149 [Tilletia laevis]KAE8245938.1 hypothetical protein A4X06_0g5308 [Tilletia controversa]